MNGNLKALKKILFILQKSYSGLEHKPVIWDSPINCKQEAARVTALLPLEEAKLLRLGQRKLKSRAGHSLGCPHSQQSKKKKKVHCVSDLV